MVAIVTRKGDATVATLTERFDGQSRPNQFTHWKTQLLVHAAGLFATAAVKQAAMPYMKQLRATIGRQALEIDFLYGVLARIDDVSRKR